MSKIIGELNAAGICGSMNTANMTGTIGNGIVKYDSSTELYTGEYDIVPKAAEERNAEVRFLQDLCARRLQEGHEDFQVLQPAFPEQGI